MTTTRRAPPRVTGLRFIDQMLDDIARIPPASLQRRALLIVLLVTGVLMMGLSSVLIQLFPPIPYKLIPDIRIAGLVISSVFLGLYAAGGQAMRRKLALWGVVGYVALFHLEEATVKWIGPYPGSITGTRVGLVGTAGSLLALAAVLLLHMEVERVRLAHDLADRGAPAPGGQRAANQLAAVGARRVLSIAAGVAALGLLVAALEPMFGNDAPVTGVPILVVGAALMLLVAILLGRSLRRAAA